jgi:hypothetical protein
MTEIKIEYPDVDIELNPLSKEALEVMKSDMDKNLKMQKDKQLVNFMKSKQIDILEKIKQAKLKGEKGVYIDKELYKASGRDFRYKLKKTYGDIKKKSKGCLPMTKKILYYVDLVLEGANEVVDNVSSVL